MCVVTNGNIVFGRTGHLLDPELCQTGRLLPSL